MDYKSLRVKDLLETFKSRGLKGWSRLRKSDLIFLIEENNNLKKENVFGRPDKLQTKVFLEQRKKRKCDEENFHKQLRRQQMISDNLFQKQRERDELQEWCNLQEQLFKEEHKFKKCLMEAGFFGR